jgi:hypothetical protein
MGPNSPFFVTPLVAFEEDAETRRSECTNLWCRVFPSQERLPKLRISKWAVLKKAIYVANTFYFSMGRLAYRPGMTDVYQVSIHLNLI